MAKRESFKGFVWVFGWLLNLAIAFRKVTQRFNVPIEAYERLGSAEGSATIEKIARLIHDDWFAAQPKPAKLEQNGGHPFRDGAVAVDQFPANHYRDHITYAPMPSLANLKKEFGKDRVSDIFDERPWELHASCVGMDRTPGMRTFFLRAVGRDWDREEQIAWGLEQRSQIAPNGYRTATHEEEYEFSKAHPELIDYVALGDSALSGGRRCVAGVWGDDGRRALDGRWIDRRFNARNRVLFVSK